MRTTSSLKGKHLGGRTPRIRNIGIPSLFLVLALMVMVCSPSGSENEENGNQAEYEEFPTPQIPFDPKTYIIYRADQPIAVDGEIDEETWSNARWTDDFVPMDGSTEMKPEYRTRVKLLWDDNFLYVAAKLEEDDLWATMTERNDPLYLDNAFELFADPDGDTHNYIEFEINALGTIWDLFLTKPYRDGSQTLSNWNLLNYQSAVTLDGDLNNPENRDQNWTAEIALPMDALLEVAPGTNAINTGDQWRMNFARAQRRLEVVDGTYQPVVNPSNGRPYRPDFYTWSPQGLNDIHYPEMWGIVQFSDQVAGKGTDTFQTDSTRNIKWALREVYYRMREFHLNNGFYTADKDKLQIDEIKVEGGTFEPTIKVTTTMFEVSTDDLNGENTWYISQNGRIWID